MTNHEIVPATAEHVSQLSQRLRKADRDEIKASVGQDPEHLILMSVATSPASWTWLYKGEPMAIFGVSPHPNKAGVGTPWLLGAEGMEKHKHFFIRNSLEYVERMLDEFPYLENFVDCRNTASIQWLSWCGFALAEVYPFYGAQRLPFIRFCQARV